MRDTKEKRKKIVTTKQCKEQGIVKNHREASGRTKKGHLEL